MTFTAAHDNRIAMKNKITRLYLRTHSVQQ